MVAFGLKGALMTFVILMLFGGLAFSILGGAAKCVGSGLQNCESLWKSVGGTIAASDAKIYDATIALQHLDPTDDVDGAFANFIKTQILFAFASLALIIFIITKVFSFLLSSQTNSMALFISIIIAVILVGVIQIAYTSIFEDRILWPPYKGVITLIANPDILFSIAESSDLIPQGFDLNVSDSIPSNMSNTTLL